MRPELAAQAALLGATKDSQWHAGLMDDGRSRWKQQPRMWLIRGEATVAVPGSPDGRLFLAADEGH